MVDTASQSSGPRLKVATGFASETGPRPDNQDFAAAYLEALPRHHGLAAAVADGVGGQKGGRVAAELSVRTFIEDYVGQSDALPPRKTAARALESINQWIHLQGKKDENLKGMAAVFTGIVLKGHRLHSFHVGDTRLYRLREGALSLLTHDHKPEGAEDTSYITRAIGLEEGVRIDYRMHDVQTHDRLLLCSDGVHGPLSHAQIEAVLLERAGPEETARRLVAEALDHNGEDNTTALVIDVLELSAATLEDLDAAFSRLPLLDTPKVGDKVDDFVLEAQLADGDYSRVFKARDLLEPRTVLLKFPKPETIGSETAAIKVFAREAWVASRVQHALVGGVLTLPSGRQTRLYIAQPFYAGETLETRLTRKEPILLAEGLDIGTKLAKAVAALHRAGIIHRDIKPENIILLSDGGLKLIDLGVARLTYLDDRNPMDHTPGTASYKAPEMFDGNAGDERTDIFAIGVTLYRMFTGGDYPYGEIVSFNKPAFGRPQPLSAKRKDLPAWLENVILTAIAPDAGERFQDGFELVYEMENAMLATAPRSVTRGNWWRDRPEKFWQIVSLVLAMLLLIVLGTKLF